MTFIPQNLRYLRKLAGLSQQAFADKVGLNRGNIASYEKGSAEPNTRNLLKIVRYFNIDVVDFVEKELSTAIADQPPRMTVKEDRIVFQKRPVPEILANFQDSKEEEEGISSIEVLMERSSALHKIMEGTRQYYRFMEGRLEATKNYEELHVDFIRCLELSHEVLDINRQLLRVVVSAPASDTPTS